MSSRRITGGFGAGGVVATNHVTGSATGYIEASAVLRRRGAVALDAENNSTIAATETTALTADGNAVTLEAAFNVIGWSGDNLARWRYCPDRHQLPPRHGRARPDAGLHRRRFERDRFWRRHADGKRTGDDHRDGGDQAAAGNGDATSTLNVGGVLATNKIDTATQAYIGTAPSSLATATSFDTSSVAATGGTVKLAATDSPTLTATSTITLSSTASTGGVASALSGDYAFTEKSGTQTVKKGDQVYTYNSATKTGTVYSYVGDDNTKDAGNSVDLGATDYRLEPLEGRRRRLGLDRQSGGRVQGGRRSLRARRRRGFADATIGVAPGAVSGSGAITGGTGINVNANEAASITADTESNLTSTGNDNGSGGRPAARPRPRPAILRLPRRRRAAVWLSAAPSTPISCSAMRRPPSRGRR